MKRAFQPGIGAVVLSAAMLLAVVSSSAAVINHTGNGTYNYPPLTAGADSVYAYDTTTVNLLADGSIGDDLRAYEDSTVRVSGGSIGGDLFALNNSMVTVSGGTIADRLMAKNDSIVNVTGGTMDDLRAFGTSTVNISGGTIGGYLGILDNSTLTILGTFNFAYGDYVDGGPLDGQTLTGFLADGTAINNPVWIYASATVTLQQAVPEPSIVLLLVLGASVWLATFSREFSTGRVVS